VRVYQMWNDNEANTKKYNKRNQQARCPLMNSQVLVVRVLREGSATTAPLNAS